MDEGRALGVEIVKALTHIIQDVESITQTSVWIVLDKVCQVTMKPLHYQTDVVSVTTIMDSNKANHIGVLQLAHDTTLIVKLSDGGVILSTRVVPDSMDQNVMQFLCDAFHSMYSDLVDNTISSRA